MVGEDALERWVRGRRRAYVVGRRIGMRQTGESGSGHGRDLAVGGAGRNWPVRASCQSRARGATVVAMAEENFLSQVPAASALFLREAEVRRGIEYLYFGHAALWRTIDARDRKSTRLNSRHK